MTHTLIQDFQKKFVKKTVPNLKPGMTVKITHKFMEGAKERSQIFQGVIIKLHENTSINATFTVRKVVDGIGVEKVFPLHSPKIEIEVVRASKVRRAKLYFLRERAGKSARLKERYKEFADLTLDTENPRDTAEIVTSDVMEDATVVEEVASTEAPAEVVATSDVVEEKAEATETDKEVASDAK